MQQIFVNSSPIDNIITVTGEDAHHLIKVVRLRVGERIRVSVSGTESYLCEVSKIFDKELIVSVVEPVESTELKNKIYLFQAVAKGDKLETIIEKSVELGVYEIIPVEMKNCVVKLDEKKRKNRLERYQAISVSAARQSKRSIVPQVHEFMSFSEALEYAKRLDVLLLPFESKNGMKDTYDVLDGIKCRDSIGVFIGPEGGFDSTEIDMVKDICRVISLGKRILRTETAAIATMSMLMLKCEELQQ